MLPESRAPFAVLLLGAALLAPPALAQLTAIGSQYWDQASSGIEGDRELGDEFGRSLATGDFNCDGIADLAIGVPYEDVTYDCDGDGTADPNECIDAGAVQVIYGSAQGLHASLGHADQLFTQDSAGVPSSPEVDDHFGWSVAAMRVPRSSCDDLAVGAPEEDVSDGPFVHVDAGAVFYFRGTTSGLVPDGLFVQGRDGVPESPEDDDRFGFALGMGPTIGRNGACLNGEGIRSLAIGAPGEDLGLGGNDEGIVIVVVAPCSLAGAGTGDLPSHFNCGSSEAACQALADNGFPHRAGEAIAAGEKLADFLPEGQSDHFLALGAPEDSNDAANAGNVQIWTPGNPGQLTAEHDCKQGFQGAPGAAESGDRLGKSLVAGDFDGDGEADIAAGAPFEDVNANSVVDAGGVSLFYTGDHASSLDDYPSGGGPPPGQFFDQDETHFDVAQTADHFGESLGAGDFDHDGIDDLVIGVPDENVGSDTDAGMFHVLYGTSSGLSTTGDQAFDLDDPNLVGDSQPLDYFGQALAAGDFDGDGRSDLAVSAPATSSSSTSGGGLFVLYGGLPGGFLDAIDFDRSPSSFSEAAGTITITVQRTGSVILPLDVTYHHLPTGATTTAGADYVDFGGNLHWNAGDRSDKTFTITILNDTVDEPPETLVVGLDAGGIHCQEPPNWTITITDNDPNVPGTIHLSAAAQSTGENGGSVTVTVNRVAGTTAGASVHYATADGTALGGDDYTAVSGTLTFALNQLSQSFQIPILEDPWDEAAFETFTLTLSSPGGGATLGSPATQTITILDTGGDTGLFGDGFESGSLAAWSSAVP